MKSLLTFLLGLTVALPTWGAQSLRLASDTMGRYLNGTTNVGSFRIEMRVHTIQTATGYKIVASRNNLFTLRLYGGYYASFISHLESEADAGVSFVSLTGDDLLIRAQRNVTTSKLSVEVWEINGTGYVYDEADFTRGTDTGLGNQYDVGYEANGEQVADVAWARFYSTVLAVGATRPALSEEGDLASYQLEGNGNDTSGNSRTLTLTGTVGYQTTPAVSVNASAGTDAVGRVGAAQALDGSGSSGEGALTYAWSVTASPAGSTPVLTGATTATPTLTTDTFGQYTVSLTVTDSTEATSTDTVDVGQVVTDAAYRVSVSDSSIAAILGPMLMLGHSPWTWFDDRHAALGGWFGNWLDTEPDFDDEWNTALAGTITAVNGSATVAGVSTTFQTDFCSGGTTPDSGVLFVVWYPVGDGTFGRRDYGVTTCTSQTSIVLDRVYDTTSGTSAGLNYAKWTTFNQWTGTSNNWNYYDNVLAYYSLYYRTGLTKYRTWARALADRWWTMPDIDGGRDQWGSHTFHAFPPRMKSVAGLMLRALDGRTEMWAGLNTWIDAWATSFATPATYIGDVRESGYTVAFVALAARFNPDADKRETYITALENAISEQWAPTQTVAGIWQNPTYGYKSANDGSTLTATNGSANVTLAGGTWQESWFWANLNVGPNAFLICAHSFNGIGDCESTSYIATYVDSTHATLDRVYEGTTSSTHGWQLNNLVGEGTQPFTTGIAATGWYWAYQALAEASSASAPAARQFVLDIADWLTLKGYRPSTKGLFYGRDFPNCGEPTPEGNQFCASEDAGNSRYLSSEVVNAYTVAGLLTGNTVYKTQGDILFGAMWGGPDSVGPNADGTYNSSYADGGWTYTIKKAKDFGFSFGFGFGVGWPAERLGIGYTSRNEGNMRVQGNVRTQ
jgi:hypothetical protein